MVTVNLHRIKGEWFYIYEGGKARPYYLELGPALASAVMGQPSDVDLTVTITVKAANE